MTTRLLRHDGRGLDMLRGDARLLWLRLRDSRIVTDIRVSTTITRESLRSIWAS